MSPDEGWRRPLVGIALLAVAVRLVAALAGPVPQIWEYDDLARAVLRGDGLVCPHDGVQFRSYYSGIPYIALTAALYAVAPDGLRAVQVAQCLVAAFSCVTLFALARRMVGPSGALCAALLLALHPGLCYYDVRNLHPLGFDTASGLVALLALFRVLEKPDGARALLAGVAVGVAALQRGSLLPFMVIALVVLARQVGRRAAFLTAVGALVCLLPWVARNMAVQGRPMMLSTTGEHLWIGNTGLTDGMNWSASGQPVLRMMPPALARQLAGANELERDRVFKRAVWEEVTADPVAATRRVLRKAAFFWLWTPATGTSYATLAFGLYMAYYAGVLALAFLGMRSLRIDDPRTALLIALVTSVWCVHALVYFEMRHRWAIEPVLLIVAGAGLARLSGQPDLRSLVDVRLRVGRRQAGERGMVG